MGVLNADPTTTETRNVQDLDKVEQHIIRVVLPILQKLKAEQAKRRVQQQQQQQIEAQKKAHAEAQAQAVVAAQAKQQAEAESKVLSRL